MLDSSLEFSKKEGDFILLAKQVLPQPVAEVFPFFAAAENLERLTPEFLNFKIVTPAPIEMREGLLIDYRIMLRFIPLRWRTLISCWEPPLRFVDEQIKGPYLKWHHEHTFEELRLNSGMLGTLVTDTVHYRVFGGALIESVFVRPDLKKIFAYRQQKLRERFGSL